MDDYQWTGKPSRYKTNTNVNSAFHPTGVGKLSTGVSGWGYGGARASLSGVIRHGR